MTEGIVVAQSVQEYLESKRKEEETNSQKSKNDLLLRLGLYRKEYSPNGCYSAEYPYHEWDNEKKDAKFFKRVLFEVTDEEYEELLKYEKLNNTHDDSRCTNSIASVFKVLAWISFILGFLVGLRLGFVNSEFSLSNALIYWTISLVSGMMFLGFAEIIQLLTDIKNK